MPLTMLQPGSRANVTVIHGGRGLNQRLAAMGILPGTEITLIKSGGPVIVDVRGIRFILGHGMARRVMVNPVL